MDSLRGVIGIAVCLGLAVLVHEFGHFLWAKICRVRVLKFSIGFGKFIVKWTYRGTEYGIAWFPFGGYVMMHGAMNPETGQAIEEAVEEAVEGVRDVQHTVPAGKQSQVEAAASTGADSGAAPKSALDKMVDAATSDSSALYNKPYHHKLLIYSGGVVMNWLTAVVTIGLIFAIGFDAPRLPDARVGAIQAPNAVVTREIPLQKGDLIRSISGKAVADWSEFVDQVVAIESRGKDTKESLPADDGTRITMEVDRPGSGTMELSMPALVDYDGKRVSPLRYVLPHYEAYIEEILPSKPADKAGIRPGDLIVAIDDEPIDDWDEMASIIRASAEKPLRIVVKRGVETIETTVVPEDNPKDPGVGQLGIIPGSSRREWVQEPVLTAFASAPIRTVDTTVQYIYAFVGIFERLFNFQFRAAGEDLGGPIQIAQLAYRSARRGLSDFLKLFFAVNIALAVFNLIPIPLLDGSLLFFATYEAIARKPFPARLHVPLLYAGLAFIIILFIAVSVNDVLRLVR